jgi:hypothetical protein
VFARPEKLRECIVSISKFDPGARVYVCIDICTDQSSVFFNDNRRLIDVASSLKSQHLIIDYRVTETNLKTKAAANFAFEWVFGISKNVVLLEDDLILISQPSNYIKSALSLMNSRTDCAMATLYSSKRHSVGLSQSSPQLRLTRWPIMWGIILTETHYSQMRFFLDSFLVNGVPEVVHRFSRQSLNSWLARVFRGRFVATWTFKFKKAFASETAWDTQWHFGLWAKDFFALSPAISILQDTGVDYSSVSPKKLAVAQSECVNEWVYVVDNLGFCRGCEKIRELDNRVLPQLLSRN